MFASSSTETNPFLAGMTLVAGEIPAPITASLTPACRAALTACLESDRLDHIGGARGYRKPGGDRRIAPATVRYLVERGLLVVVQNSKLKRRATHARLTARGEWYARTIMSQTLQRAREVFADRHLARGAASEETNQETD